MKAAGAFNGLPRELRHNMPPIYSSYSETQLPNRSARRTGSGWAEVGDQGFKQREASSTRRKNKARRQNFVAEAAVGLIYYRNSHLSVVKARHDSAAYPPIHLARYGRLPSVMGRFLSGDFLTTQNRNLAHSTIF